MSMKHHSSQSGGINGLLIAVIGLSLLAIGLIGSTIYFYQEYDAKRTNVNGQIQLAEVQAKKDQADEDEAKFAQREKEPNRNFVGPDDYGRLTFSYPKTWSVYISKDASTGGDYEAYLNPVVVPPVSSQQKYALRVSILTRDYGSVIEQYASLVKQGDLKSSVYTANGQTGTRLDGTFSNDVRGAVVVFKIRDKTVVLQTDADTFKPDFDALTKTVNFNS